ncbi:MAG: hypothetical protein H0V17_15955 [Deltaproteobacteria bacterium]|nr:hypothetical protein [Deltaproteobacteria bacterium]
MNCAIGVRGDECLFGAYIDGETRCAFWTDEPVDHDFDPAKLIAIDLAQTPGAAALGEISWDAVEVDDCVSGPNGGVIGTTLGPRWPEMSLAGAVYLERAFWQRIPDELRPPCPPEGAGTRAHEFMTAVYWPHTNDPRAGIRYIGHHAMLLEQRGALARVAVYPPGTSSHATARASTMWIDLESVEQCDAGPESLTKIGSDSREGALFLIANRLATQPQKELS